MTATANSSTFTNTTSVTITNLAPIANAGPNQSASLNALVTLDGSGSSDPDGHTPLSYRWKQIGGLNVVLSSPTISMPTFTAPAPAGILTFTLTVTDARGLAGAPAQTLVFVGDVPISNLIAANSSPTTLGQATTFTATAIGSNVGYQWDFGDGASANGSVITRTYGAVGTFLAIVTATNNLNTVTATTTVNVVNPTPTITSVNPISITAGSGAFTLIVSGLGFVAGSILQWNNFPRPTTLISSTQLTAAISSADVAASGTISLTALNPAPGGGPSNSVIFTVSSAVLIPPRYTIYLPFVSRN